MSTITVIFKDPEQNFLSIEDVSKDLTIAQLRTIFKQKGGNEGDAQWKANAEILEDSQKISDIIKNVPVKKLTISTVAPVEGGLNI